MPRRTPPTRVFTIEPHWCEIAAPDSKLAVLSLHNGLTHQKVRLLLDEIMLVEVHRACVRIVREREKQAARLRESMERDLREDEP